MSANVYAFQSYGSTVMIDQDSVNFTGTWSSTGTYVATDHDSAVYGGANYIAVINNIGGVPTYVPRRSPAKWSPLVLIRQGTNTGNHTAEEAYQLAEEANDLATTALAAANSAESTANEALGLVEQAETVAGVALTTAWAGTAAAAVADAQADSARAEARQAYEIAVAGTQGGDLAYRALQTAWSGTSGANSAFAIAVAGTNAAAVASTNAEDALQTAWVGTESANTLFDWFGTIPGDIAQCGQEGSQFSVILRDQGTLYTDDQVRINHQQDGQYAFELFVAGTNFTNAQVIAGAGSTGQAVFWAGTDYTNTQIAIEAAARITNDDQIRVIANAGTNLAALAVPLAGGTMTGNLRTPQIFLGSGTVPASDSINGTIYYDFTGPAFQETVVDRNLKISAKNYTAGAEISAVLISTGTIKTLTYDAEYSWFGTQTPYTSPTAGKKIIVPMASTGTVPSKVLGATTAQI
jgi:hypothetical protein